MTKFYGMKTCTANLQEQLEEAYQEITHPDIAKMLAKDGFIDNVHTIQISTCHRFASICFDSRETLLKFTETEHLIIDNPVIFQPDHDDKIRISIENLPIELPDKKVKTFLSEYTTPVGKTYYPGIKHNNKFFTTGTRVYQCVRLTKHIPKHVYQFGRYLRIRYDDQPKEQPIQQNSPDTPEIQEQEQETVQQQTQPQPQGEIQETRKVSDDTSEIREETQDMQSELEQQRTRKFNFAEFVGSTKPKMTKAQSLETIPTETIQKTQNNEQLKNTRHLTHSKESLIWWKTPISGKSTPKCEIDPNELYNIITQKERERFYEKTPEKGYNVPLLKDSERRRRAILRRRARDSSSTGFNQDT